MKKSMLKLYGEWRRATEAAIESCSGSIDCGEAIVREDFSDYIKLEKQIDFDEMWELEKKYENLLDNYERAIEMLEEMGYYASSIDDIEEELENLEILGYSCYFDNNKDRIVLDK